MLCYICYVLLPLPKKWYQSLELKEQREKEKIIWSLDRRDEPSQVKWKWRVEDKFYYIVAGHPCGTVR
jgi:hypothetical protein